MISNRNSSAKGDSKTHLNGFSPIPSSKLAQNKRASSDYFTLRNSAKKHNGKQKSEVTSIGSLENVEIKYSSPTNKNNSVIQDIKRKGNSSNSQNKDHKVTSNKKIVTPVNSFMNSLHIGLNSENLTINRIPMSPIGLKTLSENLNLLNTRCNTEYDKFKALSPNITNQSIASQAYLSEKKIHHSNGSNYFNSLSTDQMASSIATNENFHEETSKSKEDKFSLESDLFSKQQSARSSLYNQNNKTSINQSNPTNERNTEQLKVRDSEVGLSSPKHQPKVMPRSINEPKKEESRITTVDNEPPKLSRYNFLNPKTLIQNIINFATKKRFKCPCDPNLHEDQTCSKALKWMSKKYKPNEHEYLKEIYQKLLADETLADIEYVRQIKKDINRTFPDSKFFSEDSEG